MTTDKQTDEQILAEANAAAPDETPEPLSKDQIRENAKKNRSEPDWVWIEEWETKVYVQRLSAPEHEEVVEFSHAGGMQSSYRLALKTIELGCIDPTFDLDDDDDFNLLNSSDPSTIHRLVAAVNILSNLREGRLEQMRRSFRPSTPGPEMERSAALEGPGRETPDREDAQPDAVADAVGAPGAPDDD